MGLGQKELAALFEVSTKAVQAIELGKLKLSDDLAKRIASKTGVDVEWLLKNDPSVEPVTRWGDPYTKAEFQLHQTRLTGPKLLPGHFAYSQERLIIYLNRIADLMTTAHEKDLLGDACYKLDAALSVIETELGSAWKGRGKPCPTKTEVSEAVLEEMRPVFLNRAEEVLDKFNALLFIQFRKKFPRDKHVAIKCMSGRLLVLE